MTWKDVYELPLQHLWSKCMTANNNMAFDFMNSFMKGMFTRHLVVLSTEQREDIIAMVNGDKKGTIEGVVEFIKDEGIITVDGKVLLLLRGWGYLTGTGGLNLSTDQAIEIQNSFGEYILQKLTGK